ncbi:MAG: exosome complex RNA-binding protein Csl4 [Candidatus Methanomethylicaceae archaeon]
MNEGKTRVAIPGEKLGVEEEFMPGEGVYVEDGGLYSSSFGALIIDPKSRKVGVSPATKVAVPEVGDIVEGVVVGPMRDDSTVIEILSIRGKRKLKGVFTGILHVSQATKSYIDTIFDAVGFNDWVLAKVVTDWPPYQLSTAEDELGVIYATCPRCGEELVLKRGRLFCNRDKSFERRKVSIHYLIKEGSYVSKDNKRG